MTGVVRQFTSNGGNQSPIVASVVTRQMDNKVEDERYKLVIFNTSAGAHLLTISYFDGI